MVQCIQAFMECCYIARRNAITSSDLKTFHQYLTRFHDLRDVFIEAGVRTSVSLPRQHSLSHYVRKIELFGSPNGICSSITESLHIRAVKEPWRRSNRFEPLPQMMKTISRLDKLASLRRVLDNRGMLGGVLSQHTLEVISDSGPDLHPGNLMNDSYDNRCSSRDDDDDGGPLPGPMMLAQVTLAVTAGE